MNSAPTVVAAGQSATEPAPLSAWSKLAWLAALLVSLVLLLSDPPKRPIVPAEGWNFSGAFVPAGPDIAQLPESLLQSPEARFWTTWTPEALAQPGRIESPVFLLFLDSSRGFAATYADLLPLACNAGFSRVGTGVDFDVFRGYTTNNHRYGNEALMPPIVFRVWK